MLILCFAAGMVSGVILSFLLILFELSVSEPRRPIAFIRRKISENQKAEILETPVENHLFDSFPTRDERSIELEDTQKENDI